VLSGISLIESPLKVTRWRKTSEWHQLRSIISPTSSGLKVFFKESFTIKWKKEERKQRRWRKADQEERKTTPCLTVSGSSPSPSPHSLPRGTGYAGESTHTHTHTHTQSKDILTRGNKPLFQQKSLLSQNEAYLLADVHLFGQLLDVVFFIRPSHRVRAQTVVVGGGHLENKDRYWNRGGGMFCAWERERE